MDNKEFEDLLNEEQQYKERTEGMLDETSRKNLDVFDKLHELFVYNPRFVDKNEDEIPATPQKRIIFEFGAIIGEFYRNDNQNMPNFFGERQEFWLYVWAVLVGNTDEFFDVEDEEEVDDEEDVENSAEIRFRWGNEIFDNKTLDQIKKDLRGIEANMVLGLGYTLRGSLKDAIIKHFIGDSSREAMLLAHYRIQARIVDWCKANPHLSVAGEKIEGKLADAYRQIITSA